MSEVKVRRRQISVEREDNPIIYAQRLYVQFLQGLFNFNATGCLHWEPDLDATEIVIRAEAPLDMKVVGKRPAITVVMGPYQFANLGIDNMMYLQPLTERQVRSDLINGHLVVYCLAENDQVAQWIAHMVIHGTRVNQRLLEGRGGFHQIARPAPSANSPSPPGALVPGDHHGLVMVQVNIPYSFQWTWSTEPKSPSSAMDLEMVTKERRASDYDYPSPQTLKRVHLSMSTTDVLVRRVGTTVTSTVAEGVEGLQAVIASKSTSE